MAYITQRAARLAAEQAAGPTVVVPAIRVGVVGDRVVVNAPYNTEFVVKAHELGGVWSPDDKSWSFDAAQSGAVSAAVSKVYS